MSIRPRFRSFLLNCSYAVTTARCESQNDCVVPPLHCECRNLCRPSFLNINIRNPVPTILTQRVPLQTVVMASLHLRIDALDDARLSDAISAQARTPLEQLNGAPRWARSSKFSETALASILAEYLQPGSNASAKTAADSMRVFLIIVQWSFLIRTRLR